MLPPAAPPVQRDRAVGLRGHRPRRRREVPLTCDGPVRFALKLVRTRDTRPWTGELARNRGAALASGEVLLMTDVDHILTSEIVDLVRGYRGDMLKFRRRVADLDERGGVYDVREALPSPPNIFAVRKSLFLRLGGYGREYLGYGADRVFRSKYEACVARGIGRAARRPLTLGRATCGGGLPRGRPAQRRERATRNPMV